MHFASYKGIISCGNASYFNKIFSGTQPRQFFAGRSRRFGNYLCPHHQGCDVSGYPERSLYIPARAQYSWPWGPWGNARVSSHITTLMMGTEIVPETSVSTCNQLTRLCAREDFIEFSHRESFKLYIASYLCQEVHHTSSLGRVLLSKVSLIGSFILDYLRTLFQQHLLHSVGRQDDC
jgi:hypothetical protein